MYNYDAMRHTLEVTYMDGNVVQYQGVDSRTADSIVNTGIWPMETLSSTSVDFPGLARSLVQPPEQFVTPFPSLSSSLGLSWRALMASGSQVLTVAASDSVATLKARADYVCSGVNDETTINAALSAAGVGGVALIEGNYKTSAPITLTSGQILSGTSRRGTRIRPQAQTFAGITITGSQVEWKIENLTIDYADAAQPATNAAAIGISLIASGGNYPFQFSIRNVTIQYCYAGFYDPTAAFMYDLVNVYVATPQAYGFRKETAGGTNVTLINCYVNGTKSGVSYQFQATDQLTLINCAADNQVGGGNVFYASACRLNIIGFFAESNTIPTSNSIIQVAGCMADIRGTKFVSNTYTPTVGNEAYGIRSTDSSQTIISLPMSITPTNSGAGTSYEVIATSTPCFVIGDNTSAATNTGGGASYAVYTANNNLTRLTTLGGIATGGVASVLANTNIGFTVTRSGFNPSLMQVISAGSGETLETGVVDTLASLAVGASRIILSSPPNGRNVICFTTNDTDKTSMTALLSNGVLTKLGGGSTWDIADTAGKECLLVSGGNVILKNNLASAKYFSVGIVRYF